MTKKLSLVDHGDAQSVSVRRVESLGDLSMADLTGVRVVVFSRKGSASHAEVVCRIKGIALVSESDAVTAQRSGSLVITRRTPMDSVAAMEAFTGQFQVSAFEPEDVQRIAPELIGNIFVRMEHLLYRAITEDPDAMSDWARLSGRLRMMVDELLAVTPESAHLLLRGADVRSDDAVLARQFHGAREENPEMGVHGVRWLLRHPEWVALEAELVSAAGPRVIYAVPFVTRTDDFDRFAAQYGAQFRELVPFVESPAAAWRMRAEWPSVCIGLKDLTQFFFAADRASSSTKGWVDFAHEDLVAYITATVTHARRVGTQISVYQDPNIFGSYCAALGGSAWTPSFAAGELEMLSSAARAVARL